jgi:glucuronosyltransferase
LQTLAVALADKGHDITFVSTYPLGKQVKNYRDIKIPFDEDDKEFLSEIAKDPKGKGFFYMFPKLTSLIYRLGNETLQMKEMRKLMNEEKFDLVIVGYFLTEFMLGVADHFKCPSILFSPAGPMGAMHQSVGNPLGVSGTPHLLAGVKEMNFVGRLKTFLASGGELLLSEYLKYRARQVYE